MGEEQREHVRVAEADECDRDPEQPDRRIVGTSVKIAKQMAESVMMTPQMRTPSLLLIFWSTMPPVKQPIMRATKYTIVRRTRWL